MRRYALFVALLLLCIGYSCKSVDQVAPGGSTLFLSAQPAAISANGISTLTVSGTRGNGAPLPDGTVVHFSVNNAGTVSPNPVETHGGQATATFHAANFSGDITVTASSGTGTVAAHILVGEFRADHVFVSANPPTLPLDGGSSQIRTVVTDLDGNQLQGIGVQFSTSRGTLRSGGRVLRTNQNGVVTDTVDVPPCVSASGCDVTVTATTLDGSTDNVVITVDTFTAACDFTVSPDSPTVGQSAFFIDATPDPTGDLVAFQWNFGDGSTGSGRSTQHTYRSEGTFTVVHTIIDSSGNSTSCNQTITVVPEPVGDPPSCLFNSSPADPKTGEEVVFDANESDDTDGTIETYKWDFGDGTPVRIVGDPATSHRYSKTGTFTVTLTVTDNDGNESSCTGSVTVTSSGGGGGGNTPPTCSFTISPSSGDTTQLFTFNGSASTDSDGTITTYDWDFGDGNFGSGVSTSHTYSTAATYTIFLTVTDNDGDSTSCSKTLTVSP